MERATIEEIVGDAVAPVSKRVDEFIESEKESRRVMATLVTRLTTVIAGDREFKQLGLVDTVASHEKAIADFTTSQTEVKAYIRSAVFIGGGLATVLNVAIQILLK